MTTDLATYIAVYKMEKVVIRWHNQTWFISEITSAANKKALSSNWCRNRI